MRGLIRGLGIAVVVLWVVLITVWLASNAVTAFYRARNVMDEDAKNRNRTARNDAAREHLMAQMEHSEFTTTDTMATDTMATTGDTATTDTMAEMIRTIPPGFVLVEPVNGEARKKLGEFRAKEAAKQQPKPGGSQ